MNKFFINYKIHVGEGEGPEIARRYGAKIFDQKWQDERDKAGTEEEQ
mgnify:CR=1 FL=1